MNAAEALPFPSPAKRTIRKITQSQFMKAADAMRDNAAWFKAARPSEEKALAKLKELCGLEISPTTLTKLRACTKVKWSAARPALTLKPAKRSRKEVVNAQLYILARCIDHLFQKAGISENAYCLGDLINKLGEEIKSTPTAGG